MDALGGGVIWRKKKEKRADGRRLDRSARVFYPRARGVGDEPKGRAALRSRERDRKVYCRRGGREKSERERDRSFYPSRGRNEDHTSGEKNLQGTSKDIA